MPRKSYTPEQKASILNRASEIGAAAAAKEAGVSYQTVLKWSSTAAPGAEKTESVEEKIKEKLDKIKEVEGTLKELKAELKVLKKAKEKAEKEKAALAEAEQKKELMAALEKSGKTLEEVLEFLK